MADEERSQEKGQAVRHVHGDICDASCSPCSSECLLFAFYLLCNLLFVPSHLER